MGKDGRKYVVCCCEAQKAEKTESQRGDRCFSERWQACWRGPKQTTDKECPEYQCDIRPLTISAAARDGREQLSAQKAAHDVTTPVERGPLRG
jgi:hypothetical protein